MKMHFKNVNVAQFINSKKMNNDINIKASASSKFHNILII